ncbi:putative peptide zinc metalloprotease protein [Frankia sp. Hr75.2]|nr:putative peptide zinc metalloprotease protein [Frankia sp. Hr75.2]
MTVSTQAQQRQAAPAPAATDTDTDTDTDTATVTVWDRLADAANPAHYRPKRQNGLVWRELRSARGEEYVVVQNPDAATYRKITMAEFYLFELMDGSRSVQDLVVAYMMKYHRFALPLVLRLVRNLKVGQMLTDPPRFVFGPLGEQLRHRPVSSFATGFAKSFVRREFPLHGLDGLVGRAYDRGVWVLFTRPAKIVMFAVAVLGVPLLAWSLSSSASGLADQSLVVTVPTLYGCLLVVAVLHELAHAFAAKSYGRVVRRGGLSIFYGSPGMFVDTQDMWMEPRGPRMVSAWAGPFSGFVLAGLSGIVLVATPDAPWAAVVAIFGTAALAVNLAQLTPLIQLDGYYMLMDWLELPNLRARALGFVRGELAGKVRRRERFDRTERVLTIFGLAAAAYTGYVLVLAAGFAWVRAKTMVSDAVAVPSLGRVLAATVVLLLTLPLLYVLGQRLWRGGSSLVVASRRLRRLAAERRYRERVAVLANVPPVAELGKAYIQWMARRTTEKVFRAGTMVVAPDEVAEVFCLVLSGEAEVVESGANAGTGPGAGSALPTLGPGDYFPPPGLPRSPLTVRALTDVHVLRLAGADFSDRLAPLLARRAENDTRADERAELEGFALFDGLRTRDKDTLLAHLRARSCVDGEVVVAEGDPGSAFYLVRSGAVTLTQTCADGPPRTLGAGDFFGESALLHDEPHAATATSVGETRLWELDRTTFDDVVCRYFGLSHAVRASAEADEAARAAEALAGTVAGRWLEIEVGDPAPEFTLDTASGPSPVSLSDYRGQVVMLWFSRGYNCPFCREYMARLAPAVGDFERAGVQILQLAPNLVDSAREFWRDKDLPFPFLCDPEKSAYRLCGLQDIGAGEAQRNSVRGFTRAFTTGQGRTTMHALWLDVVNPSIGERLGHHTMTAMQQGVFLVGPDGVLRRKYVFGPLDEPPSNTELLEAAVELGSIELATTQLEAGS